jgi:hypothetical protein
MHLVQILLPLRDNHGRPFPPALFEAVRQEMTERFGGVTAYSRAPAEGAFEARAGNVANDDIVIVEVMCEGLERAFWSAYREHLTRVFEQEELVVRSLPLERL